MPLIIGEAMSEQEENKTDKEQEERDDLAAKRRHLERVRDRWRAYEQNAPLNDRIFMQALDLARRVKEV